MTAPRLTAKTRAARRAALYDLALVDPERAAAMVESAGRSQCERDDLRRMLAAMAAVKVAS